MSQALPGSHYCKEHQGNHAEYSEHNCEVCQLKRSLSDETQRRKETEEFLSEVIIPMGPDGLGDLHVHVEDMEALDASGGALRCYPRLGWMVRQNIESRDESIARYEATQKRLIAEIKASREYAEQLREALEAMLRDNDEWLGNRVACQQARAALSKNTTSSEPADAKVIGLPRPLKEASAGEGQCAQPCNQDVCAERDECVRPAVLGVGNPLAIVARRVVEGWQDNMTVIEDFAPLVRELHIELQRAELKQPGPVSVNSQ